MITDLPNGPFVAASSVAAAMALAWALNAIVPDGWAMAGYVLIFASGALLARFRR